MYLASTVITGWPKVPTARVKAGLLGAERIAVQALLTWLDPLGCAHQTHMLGSGDRPPPPTPQISSDAAIFTVGCQPTTAIGRLASRRPKRASRPPALEYPRGLCDLLEVSVPSIRKGQRHLVRMSGERESALPLLDPVQAAGAHALGVCRSLTPW